MSEKHDPKWKRFEILIANLQKGLSPDAKVTLNDKILGRDTNILRQIDISVRRTVGQFDIIIVIECKDYSRPVDVKAIEEFLGLVSDVGANKGALVSSGGFTEAAKARARNAGVDVYTLIDAEDHDWHSYVAIPVVCDFRGLGSGHFIIGGTLTICKELSQYDPKLIAIYGQNHEPIGTALTLLWAMWNQGEIPKEPGTRRILLKPDPIFVKARDGHFEQIEIVGEFEILQKLYFGGLPLTKFSGLKDEATGNLILPGNTEIITDFIDIANVEKNWQQIPSLNSLAVKPFMVLTAFDYYPPTAQNNPTS